MFDLVTLEEAEMNLALKMVLKTGGELTGGLDLKSTAAGGDDNFDSTSRITLQTYQTGGSHDFGESIRIDLMKDNAKGMLAWRDGFSSPARAANPKTVAWAGAHYIAQHGDMDNPDGAVHGHWAIEIPGVDGALRTRLEVLFVDDITKEIGVDQTIIRTGGADFIVTVNGPEGGSANALRVAGGNGWNKDIVFTNERGRGNSFRRWVLRENNTTEDASQNGSDFEIMRQTTTTDLLTALFIKRSNGRVGLGGTRSPQAVLHIKEENANTPLARFEPTVAMTNPLIWTQTIGALETVLSARVAGDAQARAIFRTDGKFEWGDGAIARDTVLARVAAGVLRTENTFDAQGNIRIGATSTAATTGTASGRGLLAIFNASTLPSGTPSAGIVAYSEGGVFKVKNSAGDIFNSAKQAAIASPTADAASLKTAVDAIRSLLQTSGLLAA